jgi:xylulokinase
MSILGLDIGTTGAKAVAFREDTGARITSAYREYDLRSPRPGQLELDPHDVLGAIREVTARVSLETRGDPVRALGSSTLGEAAVPVDARGKPVGNAIVGFDSRGQEEELDFRQRISSEEVFSITGHGINSSHTLFKILWRRDHDPETFAQAAKFLCFGDFTVASLGLTPRMDHSLAARTLCFDIHARRWSSRILDAAGLAADLLPEPVAPGEAVGTIGAAAAKEFGLPVGAVVGGGLHDQPAGILGSGTRPGESMLATGTVICLGVRLRGKPRGTAMAANNLCYYPTAGDEQYVSIAFNFTGGSLMKWYRDHLAGPELEEAARLGADPYDAITAGLPERPTGLLVLPHFTTTGTPWLDPRALGAILGLRLTTTRKEIVKAIMEGLLYEIRLNAELLRAAGVEIDLYKAIGGASRSRVWMQVAADVLGRPVAITSVTEGAALGAALMGARAAGIAGTDAALEEIVRRAASVEATLDPRPEHARAYDERFAVYRDLYPRTRDLSHALFELGER